MKVYYTKRHFSKGVCHLLTPSLCCAGVFPALSSLLDATKGRITHKREEEKKKRNYLVRECSSRTVDLYDRRARDTLVDGDYSEAVHLEVVDSNLARITWLGALAGQPAPVLLGESGLETSILSVYIP